MKFRKLFLLLLLAICSNLKAQEPLKEGSVLNNIILKNIDGKTYDLNAQKQVKGFILVFMTPSCDHCILYEDRVIALNKKYKSLGYPVVAIGPYGDNAVKYPLDALPAMKEMAVKKGFTFPYLSDENFKYTWLLGIKKTPTAVILKKQSNSYLIKYIGQIDDEVDPAKKPTTKFVEQKLNTLLK
ncbi:redoxin domain-containing protein [Pedobacter sp.]|uniref:redoxin domain-containing protein n=1 Tax=Pedobacter sp. TaxID=1411316 RepID=UPI00396CF413